jgi:predicted transcriptional regulator YdeE
MLGFILLIVACIAIGYLIYALSLPAGYTVTRSIVIAKPKDTVFAYLRDLNNWTAWSPWALHEPDVKIAITNPTAVGGTYAWDGKKIGAGSMEYLSMEGNDRIEILLSFLRPFKSQADVTWVLESESNGTMLTWDMKTRMPLPLRPFQNFIAKMVGHDFALGLALLRGKLDPTSEHPTLQFNGVVSREAQTYVTEHFAGTLVAMRGAMQEAYPRLWKNISNDSARFEKKPAIAAYKKVKMMQGTTIMDMGLAVTHLNAGETGITLPAGRYFQMTMNGSYEFLPSAWNTIYGQIKMQKLKIDKRRPALEVYQINPMEAPNSNDWVTLLCVPVKSS